jgi:Lrp/AsnC family transcriptional regulator for asnA, asnC and gidA
MIDEIDRKIITELQKDGRISYQELANRLDLSISTVSRRVERLINQNAIVIRALPNPAEVGFMANAIVALNVDGSKLDSVCDALVANRNVHLVALTLGRYDILASVYLPKPDMLVKLVKQEIGQLEGVLKVETMYLADLKKRSYDIPFEDFPINMENNTSDNI